MTSSAGSRSRARLMVDKITTVPKSKVRKHIGRLDDEDVLRLNGALLVFLGLVGSPRAADDGASPHGREWRKRGGRERGG